MKKTYFLLIVLCSVGLQAQTIPFPEGKLKELLTQTEGIFASDTNGNAITIDENQDGELQYAEVARIYSLKFGLCNLESPLTDGELAGIEYLVNLKELDVTCNDFVSLDVMMLPHLKKLICANNPRLSSLNLDGLNELETLFCFGNNFSTFYIHDLPSLTSLNQSFSGDFWYLNPTGSSAVILENLPGITTLNVVNSRINSLTIRNVPLQRLNCNSNAMESLNLDCEDLFDLTCTSNLLTTAQLDTPRLSSLDISNNQLGTLDLSGLPNLQNLNVSSNVLTALDFSPVPLLSVFKANNNQLKNIDLSNLPLLQSVNLRHNLLEILRIKNGMRTIPMYFDVYQNPTMRLLCCDDFMVSRYLEKISTTNYPNCDVNSFCTTTPGGEYFTVSGTARYDGDNNGCEISDVAIPYLKLMVANDSWSASRDLYIANASGNYSIPVKSGVTSFTPVFENPYTYYNVLSDFPANFPTETSPAIKNICLSRMATVRDLEIFIEPLGVAKPGNTARYKMICKNKGTIQETGIVKLEFNDALVDFVTSAPNSSLQAPGVIQWNFSNLEPFKTFEIQFSVNVNAATATPAVTPGTALIYKASVHAGVELWNDDNTMQLSQLVVNADQSNSKTCLEGLKMSQQVIGKYVHYMIRFKNTGTAIANNIVIKDVIDFAEFEASSVVPMDSSHDFITKISDKNITFIFENVNLSFEDGQNEGYLSFKIKTQNTLAVGNSFSNTANIFFDYNLPTVTNTASTVIAFFLAAQDFEFSNDFSIYPNPAADVLNIQSKKQAAISSVSIYNTLGQLVLVSTNLRQNKTIDVSALKTGNYFIKVDSNEGTSNAKFIKK